MALNFAIVAEFLVASALIAGGLVMIGYPVRALLLDGPGTPAPVPSIVVGLAILQLGCWYWFELGGNGLAVPTVTLLAAGALGTVMAIVRRGPPRLRRTYVPTLVGCAGAAVMFFVVYRAMFDLPFHTTATLGNNDAASYAIVAEHLRHHGFSDLGQLVGYDLGHRARTDAFGSTVVLGAAAAATGIDVWKLTMPLMFVLVALGGATLARLLAELFPDAPVQCGLAAVAACAGFLFFYVVGQYFLGQVIAMALLPLIGVIALRAARDGWELRRAARLAASAATVVLVYLSHYVHMLLPALVIAGAGAIVMRRGALRSTFFRTVAVLGAGAIAGALMVPQLVIEGIRRSRGLQDLEAGWALPGFLPSELAGALERAASVPHGAGGYAASGLLLGTFAAALFALRRARPRAALYAALTVALILGSYLALYAMEGVSYQQWKWITFFQPLFAGLVFATIAVAITDWATAARVRLAAPAICVGLALLAGGILAASGFAHTPMRLPFAPAPPTDETLVYVDPELSNLAVNPRLARTPALDVDIGAYWDTMWALYFLRDHRLGTRSPNYYVLTPTNAPMTLTPRDDAITAPGTVRVNNRFELETTATGATSATAAGLNADIALDTTNLRVEEGNSIRIPATITNNGNAAWLQDPVEPGVVNLGARLETRRGAEIEGDFHRQALSPGRLQPIGPGATASTTVAFSSPPPGHYRVKLRMVSEQVAWFGATVAIDLRVTPAS